MERLQGICYSFFAIAAVNIFFNILYRSKPKSVVGTNNILETLVCLGKMPVMLTEVCSESQYVSIGIIIWSLTGFIFTSHKVLMETVCFLGILVSCVAILCATFDIERIEDGDEFGLVTQTDLSNMKHLAEEISDFIGEILLGYLMYNATVTPKVIKRLP